MGLILDRVSFDSLFGIARAVAKHPLHPAASPSEIKNDHFADHFASPAGGLGAAAPQQGGLGGGSPPEYDAGLGGQGEGEIKYMCFDKVVFVSWLLYALSQAVVILFLA